MRGLLSKLLRYLMTGGAAAVVDVGGFALFTDLHIPLAVAAALSFCIAAVVNFILTGRYVFNQAGRLRRFPLFFAMALVGLGINVGVTLLGAQVVGLAPVIAKVGGIGTAFLCNFAMNVGVVFRRPVERGGES